MGDNSSSIPQGSNVDPSLLINSFNDLFLVTTHSHLSNYADKNTLYFFGNNTNNVNNKFKI